MVPTPTNTESSSQLPHCTNCGSVGVVEFCPRCGQRRANIRLPLSEFIADGLSTLVSFDNRLFRTVGPLLVRPGEITVDTLAGRRARYVPPLRLYLITSFVFFICLQFFGNIITVGGAEGNVAGRGGMINIGTSSGSTSSASDRATASGSSVRAEGTGSPDNQAIHSVEGDTAVAAEVTEKDRADGPPFDSTSQESTDSKFEAAIERVAAEVSENPERAASALLARLPWMIFLLVPIAAVWLRLLFRKCERFYVPHLVASTHLHTAVLLFLTIGQLTEFLPGPDLIGSLLSLYLPIYVARSLKRIYELSWFSTLWRLGLLSIVHLFALLAALLGSVALTGLALV